MQCAVTSGGDTETYTGLTGDAINKRISSHKTDFKYLEKETSTTLLKHVHKLKKEGKQFELKWGLLGRGPTVYETNVYGILNCKLYVQKINL